MEGDDRFLGSSNEVAPNPTSTCDSHLINICLVWDGTVFTLGMIGCERHKP